MDEDFSELERQMEELVKKKSGRVLICPMCSSKNVTYYMGMKTGVQYQCKDCDYVGTFIIELDED